MGNVCDEQVKLESEIPLSYLKHIEQRRSQPYQTDNKVKNEEISAFYRGNYSDPRNDPLELKESSVFQTPQQPRYNTNPYYINDPYDDAYNDPYYETTQNTNNPIFEESENFEK